MNSTFTCIICPQGCRLSAELNADRSAVLAVTGNRCPRGRQYAETETVCPQRTLTSTVALRNSVQKRLPVRSSCPVAKDQMMDCMRKIHRLSVTAPVRMGDIIVADMIPGCHLLAACSVER